MLDGRHDIRQRGGASEPLSRSEESHTVKSTTSTLRTSLHEFMPYGAPDLIVSRPRHMSRALWVASAAAIALLAIGTGVGSFLESRTAVVETVELPPAARDVLPPPLIERAPPPPPAAARVPDAVAPPKVAVPVPVPDRLAPVEQPQAAPPASDATSGDATASLPTSPSGTGDAIPDPNAYVYVEQLPNPVKQVKPDYPQAAKMASVEGVVQVKALVGKDGKVMDVRLERSTQPMLNDAALAAARKWVFTPGMASNQPVLCWVSIPFNFRLH
jgi:protein TonB